MDVEFQEKEGMIKRRYGNEDELSILGFGGILVDNTEVSEAERLVGLAIDNGINYFDVAPSYGNAEERLGPALAPYRKGVFLACKTTERGAEAARNELERSLQKMRTDYFDLYQLHMMTSQEDFDQAVGPGGALETLIAAREDGKVRHLGFSAHSVECALALLDHFDFDSVLFPINWAMFLHGGFGPRLGNCLLHGYGVRGRARDPRTCNQEPFGNRPSPSGGQADT